MGAGHPEDLGVSVAGPVADLAEDHHVSIIPNYPSWRNRPDGDPVDADGPRGGAARPAELSPHVLLVPLLDGMPVRVPSLGDRPEGALPAAPPHVEGEPLGGERVVRQPLQLP